MIRLRSPKATLPDDPIVADMWDRGCVGIEEGARGLVAYFGADTDVRRWEQAGWTIEPSDADRVDWVARYYAELQPVEIGTLVVAPSHVEPRVRAYQRVLWLDPGTAFGTGHHETTRMALEALEAVDPWNRDVLDVGAGSGILAIAADLLGARVARGVDVDPDTVPVADANARINRSRATFEVGTLDRKVPSASVEILVANLYAELHRRLMPSYARVVAPGGTAILTGIYEDLGASLGTSSPWFEPVSTVRDGPWTLLTLRRTEVADDV